MENGLLEDIRALLIGKRAREVRINLQKAQSDDDIEEIEIEGEIHRVLTHEAGMRSAVRELQDNRKFIAELLKS